MMPMATQRKTPPPETVAYARRRYLENAVVTDILGETGLSLGTFYKCVDGLYDDGSGLPVQPLPRRHPCRTRRPALSHVRATMADRLWRTGESYVAALEERLARTDLSDGAREGDARVYAIMVRAMRELMEAGASALPAQSEAAAKPDAAKTDAAKAEDDDEMTIDEFRLNLVRQMDAIAAKRVAAKAKAEAEARMRETEAQACDAFAFQRVES
jgi:hypothetical protein